mmetsp:Transcript_8659/g.23404  ORF Transcript_8659/g.23404 Transcript_8659/m.23404 type:complete len:104 (-) Transcript_8659:193-504(-)
MSGRKWSIEGTSWLVSHAAVDTINATAIMIVAMVMAPVALQDAWSGNVSTCACVVFALFCVVALVSVLMCSLVFLSFSLWLRIYHDFGGCLRDLMFIHFVTLA